MDSASAVLQASASEAENNSEDLAYSFVNGEISIDQFRKDFVQQRANAHSLKLKAEKISMQATQEASMHQNVPVYNQAQFQNIPHR